MNQTEKKEEEPKTSSFTFAGVGDNLIHQAIFSQYQAGDSDYDFNQDYELMKPYIEPADLSFINQETVCGREEFGLSHYPTFNGPTQILDATIILVLIGWPLAVIIVWIKAVMLCLRR